MIRRTTTARWSVPMTYVNCPNCGQKALGVATRCPQCGLPFESQFSQNLRSTPQPRRNLLGFLIAGAVIAALVIQEVWRRLPPAPSTPLPAMVVDTAPLQQPKSQATPQPRPEPQPPAQKESPPPTPVRTPTVTPAPSSAPAVVPAEAPATKRRYANTWVNVRSGPSNSAAVVQILRPGDMVLVDTLAQGWCRVVAAQRILGYVDSHFLATAPPPVQP
jgi:SH3 domain-containing protein